MPEKLTVYPCMRTVHTSNLLLLLFFMCVRPLHIVLGLHSSIYVYTHYMHTGYGAYWDVGCSRDMVHSSQSRRLCLQQALYFET